MPHSFIWHSSLPGYSNVLSLALRILTSHCGISIVKIWNLCTSPHSYMSTSGGANASSDHQGEFHQSFHHSTKIEASRGCHEQFPWFCLRNLLARMPWHHQGQVAQRNIESGEELFFWLQEIYSQSAWGDIQRSCVTMPKSLHSSTYS